MKLSQLPKITAIPNRDADYALVNVGDAANKEISITNLMSPIVSKGPAIVNSGFAGTVTATASTTVTFSSAADAILAGYHATAPVLGVTLISNALTRYIQSWNSATECVINSAVTWAGTAITSVQYPIAVFVDAGGVVGGYMLADRTTVFSSISLVSPGPIGGTTPDLIYFKKGSDIASATPALSAATGNVVDITGTTTITAFGTVNAGAVYFVTFTGVLTLTYNATSLILPGARNILTSAGDRAVMVSLGSGNWQCHAYRKASGFSIGMYDESVVASSATMTLTQCFSTSIINYGQTADVILSFIAAAKGMGGPINMVTTVAKYFRLTPPSGAFFLLDGAALAVNQSVQVASAAEGQRIDWDTAQIGAAEWRIRLWTVSGPWAGV
jgi:hypothetical protein